MIRHLSERSGGAERMICELANFLTERDMDVTCVAFDPPDSRPFYKLDPKVALVNLDRTPNDRAESLMRAAYKLIPGPLPARDRLKWRTKNGRFVKQLQRYIDGARPDVLISFLPPANTPVLVAAEGRGVKVVVTNHNVPKEDYENPARWDRSKYDRKLRLSSLDRADLIHVLFPRFGTWFPEHLQDRIIAVPNYVPEDVRRAGPEDKKREPVIVGVGRLASVKNYLALLEAWHELGAARGDWKVRIYGDGPQRGMLQRRINKLGLADSFQLCGVTRNIADVYATAAILCHPAHFEGFGLSPAEALACGVPVVAYAQTPGIMEFLHDSQNAVLASRDGAPVTNLAAALRTLMEDDGLRNTLAAKAPCSVEAFSKEAYVERWVSIIEELTAEAKVG